MYRILFNRYQQGYRTSKYPKTKIELPPNYRGRPKVNPTAESEVVKECIQSCPQQALSKKHLDMGRCVFCGQCAEISKNQFVSFTNNFELGVAKAQDLQTTGEIPDLKLNGLSEKTRKEFKKLFGRSLQLRQVSAGGCNACEADINVLSTPFFDWSRFGIQIVASPRHADGILVTGPVSKNMQIALQKTFEAVPSPKVVIAVGSCAISGGPFWNSEEILSGVDKLLPVDLYIPGCPPHPLTTLHAILSYFSR